MKICVIGLGNIGAALAGDLSRSGHAVSVFSSHHQGKDVALNLVEKETGRTTQARVPLITNRWDEALSDAEMLLITYPSFMIRDLLLRLAPMIPVSASVGFVPGVGGSEYASTALLDKGHTVFGLDRVPHIARFNSQESTVVYSKKKGVRVATIPRGNVRETAEVLEALLEIPVTPLSSFAEVILTPSNSILHTARTFSLFREYDETVIYSRNPYFYEDWTPESSELLVALDCELENVVTKLTGMELPFFKTIRDHYEAPTPEGMTRKIRSIAAFKGIQSPMIEARGGFVPHFESRYFTEDIPYGLLINKGFALLTNTETPTTDRILLWGQKWLGKEYLQTSRIVGNNFTESGVPQAFGFHTIEELLLFYQK